MALHHGDSLKHSALRGNAALERRCVKRCASAGAPAPRTIALELRGVTSERSEAHVQRAAAAEQIEQLIVG
jgi:hypothetical protein